MQNIFLHVVSSLSTFYQHYRRPDLLPRRSRRQFSQVGMFVLSNRLYSMHMSLSSMLSLMNLLMPMYTMMNHAAMISIRDTSSFRGFDSEVLLGASVVVCFCVVLLSCMIVWKLFKILEWITKQKSKAKCLS